MRCVLLISVVLLLVCGLPGETVQAKNNGYDLSWWTVDGGGGLNGAGGVYELSGTAGQPAAAALSSSPYTLNGGFWFRQEGGAGLDIFLPVIVRH